MKKPDLPDDWHIHMIGIAGAGMSGIATILAQLGYRVSGSDLKPDSVAQKLSTLGITVLEGHDPCYVVDADLVVVSAAVPEENCEMNAARMAGIPVWSRAKMLGVLMAGNFGIAVSGTHGKTTTTSMLSVVLETAGLDPTVVIGGDLPLINGNAKLGMGDVFLAEACEAFNSFLELAPRIAIVTNIEAEHLDCHGSLEGVVQNFGRFLSHVHPCGTAVLCLDCPQVRSLLHSVECRVVTYGFTEYADCRAFGFYEFCPKPSFGVMLEGDYIGDFTLKVPGAHNIQNALAVICTAFEMGIQADVVREALENFYGASRRFEILGEAHGITVIDDYAHHPTEIRATLFGAKSWCKRIVAIFQPHLYSRTQLLAANFAKSLTLADEVFITEIYPARESPIPGVSAAIIADMINEMGDRKATFIADKRDIPQFVIPRLRDGDMVLVMGAGDIRSAGEDILKCLEQLSQAVDIGFDRGGPQSSDGCC